MESDQQDIAAFVENHVSSSHLDTEVGELIVQRARGVFMWARLVLREVLRLEPDGELTCEIMAEVERIPEDPNSLYLELVKAVKHRHAAFRLMKWICFSRRPLKTSELQWAMAVDPIDASTLLD